LRCARNKSEARKPKSETNPNLEIQSSRQEYRRVLVIRISSFVFASDFEFRISDLRFHRVRRNAMDSLHDQERARVFIAIPLYCSADRRISEYFSNEEYRNELNAITGVDLIVALAREVREQGNFVVYEKVRKEGVRRFQMDIADLPCVYLEDDKHGWVAIKLKDDIEQLRTIFKELTTAVRNAGPQETASSVATRVRAKLVVEVVFPLAPQAIEPGDFQRILNLFGGPADPAMRRHELAKREARVARIDADEKAVGTSWLVGPDLLLTAHHNVSEYTTRWNLLSALFDHKFVPESGGQLLQPGRRVKFADEPLLASSAPASREVELSEAGATPQHLDFALLRLAERIGEEVGGAGSGQARGWFRLPRDKHAFGPKQGLVILGHPGVATAGSVYPLKLTNAAPSGARLTQHGCRVRYAVNTDIGSSGSPVMDEDFSPLALHHLGSLGKPHWDSAGVWPNGFNQGIPMSLIVDQIRLQVKDNIVKEIQI
jgi:trypsin-like peptidase